MVASLPTRTRYLSDPRPDGKSLWCGDDTPLDCDYVEARDVDHAVQLLSEVDGEARIVAGGQSLLPALRCGALGVRRLVSLRRIDDLKKMERVDGNVVIGAEVTFNEFLASSHAKALPFLTAALSEVGNHTIRNRTTFGGTVAWANPMGALLLALAMLDGIVVTSHRRVPSVGCVAGSYRNTLAADEIITAVEIPVPLPSRRFAFEKTTARRSGGKALASMAAGFERLSGGQQRLRLGVVGLRDHAWVSDWGVCRDLRDLDADVDQLMAQAPAGEPFDRLLPSPTYVKASASLVCRRLVLEISHA